MGAAEGLSTVEGEETFGRARCGVGRPAHNRESNPRVEAECEMSVSRRQFLAGTCAAGAGYVWIHYTLCGGATLVSESGSESKHQCKVLWSAKMGVSRREFLAGTCAAGAAGLLAGRGAMADAVDSQHAPNRLGRSRSFI